jgi:hypothetical protein
MYVEINFENKLKKTNKYLFQDGDTAFVGGSEILRAAHLSSLNCRGR